MSEGITIKFRKSDLKRIENGIKACEEIIKRGWPCISEAQEAKRALVKLYAQDGRHVVFKALFNHFGGDW